MKKICSVILVLSLLFASSASCFADTDFDSNSQLFYEFVALNINNPIACKNGECIQIDVNNINVFPMIINDRTYIPIRFAAEAIGANIDYDNGIVIISNGDKEVNIIIDSYEMTINGSPISLDAPAIIFNDRTLVPIRALAGALNKNVYWDEREVVLITDITTELSDSDVMGLTDIVLEKLNPSLNETTDESKLFVSYKNGVIIINSKYDSEYDLYIQVVKHGGNQLLDIGNIGLIANSEKKISSITEMSSLIIGDVSDWHAPWKISAKENADGDNIDSSGQFNYYFMGGCHNYNNSGVYVEGLETARTDNIKVFADNAEISDGTELYCDTVEISWENYIQGMNTTKADDTGREILKEIHKLIFDGEKVDSFTSAIPMENINVILWYGYCFSGISNTLYSLIEYEGGTNTAPLPLYKEGENTTTNSGNNTCNACRCYNDRHGFEFTIDNNYGIGDFSMYNTNGTSSIFTITYGISGKGYSYLISNKNLNKDKIYNVHATYRWYSNL